ncbi:AAA domain (Cdc48 subfamily) containing protein (apicoplast) [Babesia bovis T2Bo]|uniref:ClpC n=1 Tax=Babesia bovis TaxID=5865 RepID=A7AXE7_BABBO|nr:AAA domain (Cdc48 subfamily) containing protein [Babesia bovis T2Bo]EDO05070.1 AAA domain (Cdc48 subfamily) containing protein [Babesia bovis T2Bo]|eukprot:YP_002290850.1 clpC (apicoplast) [Babesia bovis T2Bo]
MSYILKFLTKHYLYNVYDLINDYKNKSIYKLFIYKVVKKKKSYVVDVDSMVHMLQNIAHNTIYMVHDIVFKFIIDINNKTNTKTTNKILNKLTINFIKLFGDKYIEKIKFVKILGKILIVFYKYIDFLNLIKTSPTEFNNFITNYKNENIVIFIKEIDYNYKKSLDFLIKKNNLPYTSNLNTSIILEKKQYLTSYNNIEIQKFSNLYPTLTNNTKNYEQYINNLLAYIKNLCLINKKQDLNYINMYLYNYLKNNINLIEPVVKSINKSFYIPSKTKPLSSFLFCGPSGAGKTELAKIFTYSLFKSTKQLIKLNMSEYMEAHSISKILGSPPGYVGYNENNDFINKVKSMPNCVILFDEIEKAHKSINDLMLQLLEEGKLTAANGDVLTFNNSFIIFTSNLGCDNSLTFDNKNFYKNKILKSIKDFFRPEFLGRVNNMLIFDPVSLPMCLSILDNIIYKINLNNSFYFYDIDENLKNSFIKYSYNILYGLRPLYRINELLSNKTKEYLNRFKIVSCFNNKSILLENLDNISFKYCCNFYSSL